MIVNQHIALVKAAGHAKGKCLIFDLTGVDHSGLGQWSKRKHERHTTGGIIDHFVPVEDFNWVGFRLPV